MALTTFYATAQIQDVQAFCELNVDGDYWQDGPAAELCFENGYCKCPDEFLESKSSYNHADEKYYLAECKDEVPDDCLECGCVVYEE